MSVTLKIEETFATFKRHVDLKVEVHLKNKTKNPNCHLKKSLTIPFN